MTEEWVEAFSFARFLCSAGRTAEWVFVFTASETSQQHKLEPLKMCFSTSKMAGLPCLPNFSICLGRGGGDIVCNRHKCSDRPQGAEKHPKPLPRVVHPVIERERQHLQAIQHWHKLQDEDGEVM